MMDATQNTVGVAKAGANIALMKYWGKRTSNPPGLNLPATSSLSITLDALKTTTQVKITPGAATDVMILNGQAISDPRVSAFLDLIRIRADQPDTFCEVRSENNFPTAAGLASSASGFAALTVAASRAFELDLTIDELSRYARQGSGSAPRSLFGGFAVMHRGQRDDGEDAIAEGLMSPEDWPLEVVVAITNQEAKATSSTLGMKHTAQTSPYYNTWVMHNQERFLEARASVLSKDFEKLAHFAEASALQMHASAIAAEPGVLYWQPATMACLHLIRHLRNEKGVGVFFTVDAGPQVKAVCLPGASKEVANMLENIPGVLEVICSGLGAGALSQ